MNIFALDHDPRIAAQYLHDDHVGKMLLESMQLASTVIRRHCVDTSGLYKTTHAQNRCTLWVGSSRANMAWIMGHARALRDEWSFRWPERRPHKSGLLIDVIGERWKSVPNGPLDAFVLVMPEHYHSDDPVESYRRYYGAEKMMPRGEPATWTGRERPAWLG